MVDFNLHSSEINQLIENDDFMLGDIDFNECDSE